MKKQDINIYREIKRNTEMAIKALDAVTDKIYDEHLAATVADQELQYSRLHDRAVQKLAEGKSAFTFCNNRRHSEHVACYISEKDSV